MAVTVKRKRERVSYKEPSTDEDISESSELGQSASKKRTAPSRRSARNQPTHDEPSSREPSPAASPASELPIAEPRDLRRRRRRRISYKDVSSDAEEDWDADFEAPAEHASSRVARGHPPVPQRSGTSRGRTGRQLALGGKLKPKEIPQTASQPAAIPTDGHKPAWASLPYHVLLQVFVYASHPLHDENFKPTPSISWLVQMARVCSTFTKPALTALYRNPPIFATRQTRRELVHHLINPPSGAHEDYRVMPKRLTLDATQMSGLTDPTHSVADLAALIRSLTTLREIDIFDPNDRPPFRERLRRMRRWLYPDELFSALRESGSRLRSWRWDSTLCPHGPLWMKSIHGEQAFQSLRELTLTKFHPEPARNDQDDQPTTEPTLEELLGSALAVLPNLKTLAFETCGIVGGSFLPLLPNNLSSLNITNCGEVLADALQSFLATHGTYLEELILDHNQALDLSFLVELKHSCPRLEVLRMDTTYYSSLAMSSDNEPLYEYLLGADEIPTWPSTLRVIDMQYLRKWDSAAADNFFNSLIESAEELPWLQDLTIIAMVDTDWRQRAEFRRKWSATFQAVFARKWKAPSPHLASMRAFREWKAQQAPAETKSHQDMESEKVDSFIEGVSEEIKVSEASESDAPLVAPSKKQESWGSQRLRARSKATTSYDEASEGEGGSNESSCEDERAVGHVQGRCQTVIFRIDNFRPREEIFAEADFLDAEPSDDDEWNGNDEANDGGGYAW
jgi:hypothetical protein